MDRRLIGCAIILLISLQCVAAASVYLTDTPTININETLFLQENQTLWNAINGKLSGSGTIGLLPIWIGNQTLGDSPLGIFSTDEDYFTLWNGGLYYDNTNEVGGVNIIPGTESHQAAWGVNTNWLPGAGTISTTTYDGVNNVTHVSYSIAGLRESFTDGALIKIGSNEYYVREVVNATVFNVDGSQSFSSSNWSFKQAPYVDINGGSGEERGLTFSEDGKWKWAMYVPYDSNSDRLCFSSEAYTDALCMNGNGDVEITGSLIANSFLNLNETDPVYAAWLAANNGTLARTGSSSLCAYGVANITTTTSGIQVTCAAQQGTVTGVTAGSGLTGGTITSSGTIGLNMTFVIANAQALNDSAGVAAVNNTATSALSLATTANGTANGKASPGTCPTGYVTQNTTTSGVQCILASTGSVTNVTAGTGLTGGSITSTGTIALNTTYTGTLYDALGAAAAVNTSANIQSLGFNNVSQDFVNDSASWYPIASGVSLNATKAFVGVCPSGQFINGTFNSSAPSCAPVTATVPYQSSAAGWTNNSQNTTTSLNVNVNLPATMNLGGHITAGGPYAMDLVVNNSGSASMAMLNLNGAGFNGIDLYRSDGVLMGGYGYGGTGTGTYAGYYYIDGTAAPIGFFAGGSARGVLTTGGLWGFGTMSPATLVDINGSTTIRGSLDMNSHQVDNVLDPTAAQDAATKAYVDARVPNPNTYVVLTSGATTSNTVFNVAGSTTLLNSSTYVVDCRLLQNAAAVTTGMVLRVNTTGSPTTVRTVYTKMATASAMETFEGTNAATNTLSATGSSTTTSIAPLYTYVVTGASNSVLSLEFRSEVSGSNVNLLAGSSCTYTKVA